MNNSNDLFNVISLFLAAISTAAIVLSIITFIQSSRTTKKVNSKEYQINEELKYSLMQIIASVRSIDARAAVASDINNSSLPQEIKANFDPGFSHELEIFNKLQSSPGYLLFLNSIESPEIRTDVESAFRNLSMKIPLYIYLSYDELRVNTHTLMRLIKCNINEKLIGNDETYKLMIKLCEMEGVYTNFDYDNLLKVKEEVKLFLDFLEKRYKINPTVRFTDKGIDPGQYQKQYEEFKATPIKKP